MLLRFFIPSAYGCALSLAILTVCAGTADALSASLPDGSVVSPVGFTTPVESFASAEALSPDRGLLAVLSSDAGALDILSLANKGGLIERLRVPGATSLAWTSDGLYVACGYAGSIARFAYDPAKRSFASRGELRVDASGLLNGISEDPKRHLIAVARSARHEVVTIDDASGGVVARHPTSGEPYATAFVGDALVASYFNAERIAIWRADAREPIEVATGPHPTMLLATRDSVYVANADGHDVARVNVRDGTIVRRYDLGFAAGVPPGQTPSGMALSPDARTLFVAESGFNDVAIVDVASGAVLSRIQTGWYPTAVVVRASPTSDKDARANCNSTSQVRKATARSPIPAANGMGRTPASSSTSSSIHRAMPHGRRPWRATGAS